MDDPANSIRGGEAGFTLIELLVTVLVLGIGGVTLVGAMASSVLVADAHRGMAEGEVVARDFTEAVREHAASLDPWPVCPTIDQLDPGFVAPPGWTARFVGASSATPQVRYWLPGAGDSETWTTIRSQCMARYTATCGSDPPPELVAACDPGVVRVDLEVENNRTDVAATAVRTVAVLRRSDGP